MPHVTRVTALVHKPNAARRLEIDGVAARPATAEGRVTRGHGLPRDRARTWGIASRTSRAPSDLPGRRTGCRGSSASSRVWETEPVGGPPQPDFLNVGGAGARLSSTRSGCSRPCTGWKRRSAGCVTCVGARARSIDIDILLSTSSTLDDPDLTVPHPRMTRASVRAAAAARARSRRRAPGRHPARRCPLGPDAAGAHGRSPRRCVVAVNAHAVPALRLERARPGRDGCPSCGAPLFRPPAPSAPPTPSAQTVRSDPSAVPTDDPPSARSPQPSTVAGCGGRSSSWSPSWRSRRVRVGPPAHARRRPRPRPV